MIALLGSLLSFSIPTQEDKCWVFYVALPNVLPHLAVQYVTSSHCLVVQYVSIYHIRHKDEKHSSSDIPS